MYNALVADFFTNLNREQLRAVQIDKGPILILAGAGSGKTRVITYRITHLISEKKVNPFNILAVTFTNKAAEEMKNRICKLLNDEAQAVWIRTYHSTCAKILRGASECIGIPKNFTIYDEHDQLSLVQECLKELRLNARELKPDVVLSIINRAKENLISPEDYRGQSGTLFHPAVKTIYKLYNKKLSEFNGLDFDDLIFKAIELLKKDRQVLEYYQNRFQYIMVDEYQDTNHAQYIFTKLLSEKHHNLCVVGDDDQSIYSWRGAEIRNILDFEKDYPEAKVVKLEQNYRSTKTILKAASEVVKNNRKRKKKVLWCNNEPGERIEYFQAEDDDNEAAFVTRKIIELRLKNKDLGQISVFYRLNYQSRVFEEYFVKHKIPYEVVSGLKFFERPEIKNIIAYLRVVNNPNDAMSLKRIINMPARNIGYETIEKISKFQKEQNISFLEALKKSSSIPGVDQKTREGLEAFVRMIEDLIILNGQLSLYELALRIAKASGCIDTLTRKETEVEYNRRKNIEELLKSISEYAKANKETSLEDYLENVTLRRDIDDWSNKEKVSLMTLHNAKGLEFEQVFITGLENGLIPHYKSAEEGRYEEERRLVYVGITRAKKKLFLTSAKQRATYRGGFVTSQRSPFLDEIPDEVLARTLA